MQQLNQIKIMQCFGHQGMALISDQGTAKVTN